MVQGNHPLSIKFHIFGKHDGELQFENEPKIEINGIKREKKK